MTVEYEGPTQGLFWSDFVQHSPDGQISQQVRSKTIGPYGPRNYRNRVSRPSWRTVIAKGGDAGNIYARESTSTPKLVAASCSSVGKYAPYKGYREDWYICTVPNDFPQDLNVDDSNLQDQALTRLKRKLSKRVGSVDALAPAVELRELRGLFSQATEMTTKMVKTLVDIKRTKGKSAIKFASKAWLAYGFGVRPLIDDIAHVAAGIQDYFDRSDFVFKQAASAKRNWVTAGNVRPMGTWSSGPKPYGQSTYNYELSYRWYCGGHTDLLKANDYSVWKHLGFEGGKLLPAAWELLPYSWVTDYFTNVGDFLADMFWVEPGTMQYVGVTKRLRCTVQTSYWFDVAKSTWDASPRNGSCTIVYQLFTRLPSSLILPHVGLRIKSIDEVGFAGVEKLLNLTAILGSGMNPWTKRYNPVVIRSVHDRNWL